MIRISPSLRLSIGLAFWTASVLLLGDFLGLVPNLSEAMLDARKKFVSRSPSSSRWRPHDPSMPWYATR